MRKRTYFDIDLLVHLHSFARLVIFNLVQLKILIVPMDGKARLPLVHEFRTVLNPTDERVQRLARVERYHGVD